MWEKSFQIMKNDLNYSIMKLITKITIVLLMGTAFFLISCQEDPLECPDVSIAVEIDSANYTYSITAEGIENLNYVWLVNDHVVDSGSVGSLPVFDFELVPGVYEICIRAESPDCGGVLEFCEEVEILGRPDDANCLGLSFETTRHTDNVYEFLSAFEGIDDLTYSWVVNGDTVKVERPEDRTDRFEFDFPEGVHVVCIVASSDACGTVEFCTEIYSGSQDCPALHFETERTSDSNYLFYADFEGKEEITYYWSVDGDIVDEENVENSLTDHKLQKDLEPGHHTICLLVETDRCERVEYCEEIFIESSQCREIELDFTVIEETEEFYLFEAEFPGMDSIAYKWVVNDEIRDKENYDDIETDHLFRWEYGIGYYEVCIVVFEEGCEPQYVCKEFPFEGTCPEGLSFISEADGDFAYLFTADFIGKEDVQYKWYINDEIVDKENFEGYENDHQLYWQFDEGHYYVCIETYQDGCQVDEFCEEIIIGNPCPEEVFFVSEHEGSEYYFYADWRGMEHFKYKWLINGDEVDFENYDSHDTNHKLIWSFDPGEYTVCIVTDVEGCEVVEFCETFIVEEFCPEEIFFVEEYFGDNTYGFYADFYGMESTTYQWYVNDQVVDVENTDSLDTDHKLVYDFEVGSHSICIVAETEECGVLEYCSQIVVEEPTCRDDLNFVGERDGTTNKYVFTADFEARDNVSYIWAVYVNDDYQGGLVREAGSDAGHEFVWEFDEGVSYEICLRQDGGCLDNQVCQVFTLD